SSPRLHYLLSFFLMLRRPPTLTLFPFTTLFRSRACRKRDVYARRYRRRFRSRRSGVLRRHTARHDGYEPELRDRDGAGRASHDRSEEHTSELQSLTNLVCRLLLEKKKN